MARTSSSRKITLPARYRQSPPHLNSSIAVVARAYRLQLKSGVPAHFARAPSPNPTELESSPAPPKSRQGLQRTYSILMPTASGAADEATSPTGGLVHHNTAAQLGTPLTNTGMADGDVSPEPRTPTSTFAAQYDSDTTLGNSAHSPITGLRLGTCLFRFIDSVALGLQTFDQPMAVDDFVYLRLQLESSDGGLTPFQFRDMFGQCKGCKRFMMMRGKDHHTCPGKYAPPQLALPDNLFSLLNVTTGGQGLTHNQFHDLFVSCFHCSLVFTRKAAVHHFHNSSPEFEEL